MSESERRDASSAAPSGATSLTSLRPKDDEVNNPAAPVADAEVAHGSQDGDDMSTPSFEPLFTLLTNTTTNSTIHPRVHYVFNDDDPSILTTAGATADDPANRTLIVDLVPSPATSTDAASGPGWSVSWASSLSPDFAVTDSGLAVQQSEADGSMMLRLEGVEREPVDPRADSLPSSGSGAALDKEDVEGLADEFKRRMSILQKVVAGGEKRREAVAAVAEGSVGNEHDRTDINDEQSHGDTAAVENNA